MNKKLNVKGFCTDLAYDLVGSVLYAAGIVCFVNPANMAPGGDVRCGYFVKLSLGNDNRYHDHCAEHPSADFVLYFPWQISDMENSEITGDQQFNGGFGHGQICTDLCR